MGEQPDRGFETLSGAKGEQLRLLVSWTTCLALAVALAVGGAMIALPADSSSPASPVTVSPVGSDESCARNGSACATFNRAYQLAAVGDTVEVKAGTYPSQVIQSREDVRNLSPGCTPQNTSNCITFVPEGQVTIDGVLEVRGSSVYIKGSRSTASPAANATFDINVNGYLSIEANSAADHPDHVVVSGVNAVTAGMFNVDTATFKDLDVGPATVIAPEGQCYVKEGNGFESKIGWGGGVIYNPSNLTWDSVRIHDQNGDASREQGDGGRGCHWGGLFLVAADGLTVRNSVFERNVVYHVQIQGDPGNLTNVLFEGNSFGCPVDWAYKGDRCDGQRAIQFDGPMTGFTLRNNVSANGTGNDGSSGLYGCYVGTCNGLAGNTFTANIDLADSTTAPPLSSGTTPSDTTSTPSAPTPSDGTPAPSGAAPTAPAPTPPAPTAPAPATPAPAPDPPAPAAPAALVCHNGLDDDKDGKTDLADPGCASQDDMDETDPAPGGSGPEPSPEPPAATSPAEPRPEPSGPSTTTPRTLTLPTDVVLHRGNTGENVRALQEALTELGYAPGPVDGIFGPATEQAVIDFQKDEGLVADGVAGEKTLTALNGALARR